MLFCLASASATARHEEDRCPDLLARVGIPVVAQRMPTLAADSKWHSYSDLQNDYGVNLRLYKSFADGVEQDIYGEAAIVFPPQEEGGGTVVHRYMIVSLGKTFSGLRLQLKEIAPEGAPDHSPRKWKDLLNFNRLDDTWQWVSARRARDAVIEVDFDRFHGDFLVPHQVDLVRLKWDRHPVLGIYRTQEEFPRGLLHHYD